VKPYKLTQEITNFIIEQKKNKPTFSCRVISALIEKKHYVLISKSTISAILHDAGLSLPVGRRSDKKAVPRPQPTILTKEAITPTDEAPPKLLPAPVESVAVPIVAPAHSEPIEPATVAKKEVEKPPEPQINLGPEIPILEGETTSSLVLLKAADYLIGGSYSFNSLIDDKLRQQHDLALTEGLIYLSLFEKDKGSFSDLWPLIGRKISADDLSSYLTLAQSFKAIASDIGRTIPMLMQEARCVKLELSDGNSLYLDGQFRTVWSTQYLPYNFGTTVYNIKSYINKYFYEKAPFTLFMAPGHDAASKEFFDFLSALEGRTKKITRLTIYGNSMDEIKSIPFQQEGGDFYIFGLWPWQYTDFRAIRKLGDFKPYFFEPLGKEFMVAGVEMDLLQPIAQQKVSFRGCVLKAGPAGKICMIILSNLPLEKATIEHLTSVYLSHWPNLIESYQDFSRKMEFFTYVGSARQGIKPETVGLNQDSSEMRQVFDAYLRILDIYVQRNFLPGIYENADPARVKELFYGLRAILKKENGFISITFQIPSDYSHRQELEYACYRLNERGIKLYIDTPVWFRVR